METTTDRYAVFRYFEGLNRTMQYGNRDAGS